MDAQHLAYCQAQRRCRSAVGATPGSRACNKFGSCKPSSSAEDDADFVSPALDDDDGDNLAGAERYGETRANFRPARVRPSQHKHQVSSSPGEKTAI